MAEMAIVKPLRMAIPALYRARLNRSMNLSKTFTTSSARSAAQNFTMPAMSPTMTEGNIANWNVKEGQDFSSGDILLEIETDKAQMEVEAQDDGKMVKIMQDSGAKGVKVGTRIAVIAEQDDDLSALEIPPDEQPKSQPAPSDQKDDAPAASKTQSKSPDNRPGPASSSADKKARSATHAQKQTYPLYPSIIQLLHINGIPLSKADEIPASGPKGRLLKGDVLSYIGTIDQSYSSQQSDRLGKLEKLDLSNVKPAPVPERKAPKSQERDAETVAEPATTSKIAVSISLSKILAVQKRVKESLGIHLPLSTFLTRAAELANEELPRPEGLVPTADELFDDVLGLSKLDAQQTSRGHYVPQITALPLTPLSHVGPPASSTEDIYDSILGTAKSPGIGASIPPLPGIRVGPHPSDSTNIFAVEVPKAEEERAKVFLERIKTMLQIEPGRLLL